MSKISETVVAYAGTVLVTIPVILLLIARPWYMVVALVFVVFVALLVKLGDWFRRAYFITILLMAAGSSSMAAAVEVAARGKILALGVLVFIAFFSIKGKPKYSGKLHFWIMVTLRALVICGLVSALWSTYVVGTVINALSLAALVFVLHKVGSVRWQDASKITADLGAVYLAMLLPILAGLAMSFAGLPEAVLSNGRHQGFYSNPNMLGLMSVLTAALGIAYAGYKRSVIVWMSLVAPAVAIVQSESRTAFLAICIGTLWVVIRSGILQIIAVFLLGGIAMIAMQVSNTSIFAPLLERFTADEGGDLLNQRSLIWVQVLEFVKQNPVGAGWGVTHASLEQALALGTNESGLVSVHNSYFQMFYEIGWLATPFIVLLFALPLLVALKLKPEGISGGLSAVIIAGTITHFAESAIFGIGQPYPYVFWFAVIAATVISSQQPSEVQLKAIRPRRMAVYR